MVEHCQMRINLHDLGEWFSLKNIGGVHYGPLFMSFGSGRGGNISKNRFE